MMGGPESRRRIMASPFAWASMVLASLAIVLERPLTASMALHMLVHIPAIVLAGFCAARALAARPMEDGRCSRALRRYRTYDEYGLAGLLLASFAGAYWMLPKALDQAQALLLAQALKFFVLFIVGMILLDSLTRANRVIKLFFLGNFCWMAAIAGILYQDDSVRLCNFYLLGDQVMAGRGLVALAIVLPLFCLLGNLKALRRFLRN